jgi:hypothetical protein
MLSLAAKVEPAAKQALFPAHASQKRHSEPCRELAAWLDNEKIAARANRIVRFCGIGSGREWALRLSRYSHPPSNAS